MRSNKITKICISKSIEFRSRLMPFMYIFITICIAISLLCGMYSVSEIISLKSKVSIINHQYDSIIAADENSLDYQNEAKEISYYRELSEKTDVAIDRILTIVGLIAAIVSFFGLLLSFRAPQNIKNQIDDARMIGENAKESADNAKYQLEIFLAISFDSNNDDSDVSRVQKLTRIITAYPGKPDAYIMRARIQERIGQRLVQQDSERSEDCFRMAISDYSIAMSLGANEGDCNNNIGIVCDELQLHEEALKYYNKAIALNSNDKMFFVNRGTCFETLGDYNRSLEDFDKAIELDSADLSAYYGRSFTYRSIWSQETEDNLIEKYMTLEYNDLIKSLEIDPDYRPAQERLRDLKMEMRKRSKLQDT